MTKQEFLSVENLFIENKQSEKIDKMAAYLKGKFKVLGISAPKRKQLMTSIFSGFEWNHKQVISFVDYSWQSEYRELQYAAIDVLARQVKTLDIRDIPFLENLVLEKSWWDTVDSLSVHPIGKTLIKDSETKRKWVVKWAESDELWLRRTAILHQLKYKDKVDKDLMEFTIARALGTKEFFLNKAIGWMLREYSRTDPSYVMNFCKRYDLSSLSRREALRLIK